MDVIVFDANYPLFEPWYSQGSSFTCNELREGDAVSRDARKSHTMEPGSLGWCDSEMDKNNRLTTGTDKTFYFVTRFYELYIHQLLIFNIFYKTVRIIQNN